MKEGALIIATYPPAWAIDSMDRWRKPPWPWVSIDDDLDHRREAFYRLYRADDIDARALWTELGERLAHDERTAFLHTVVLAMDAIVPDEALPICGAPKKSTPRLRTREQRLARKLAEQVQLLRVCTPPRCIATAVVNNWAGTMVEHLIVSFSIGQVPQDHDQRWRTARLGIEYTTSSKRGWVQHRRASDTVRLKVIDVANRLLAEIGPSGLRAVFVGHLSQFISDLAELPAMSSEHGNDLMLVSQKSGYLDWLRQAYQGTLNTSKVAGQSPLSHVGWATLAAILTGDREITPDDIAHALRVWQKL